jgi:hypothetical protein
VIVVCRYAVFGGQRCESGCSDPVRAVGGESREEIEAETGREFAFGAAEQPVASIPLMDFAELYWSVDGVDPIDRVLGQHLSIQ